MLLAELVGHYGPLDQSPDLVRAICVNFHSPKYGLRHAGQVSGTKPPKNSWNVFHRMLREITGLKLRFFEAQQAGKDPQNPAHHKNLHCASDV